MPRASTDYDVISRPAMPPPLPVSPLSARIAPAATDQGMAKPADPRHNMPRGEAR